MSPSECRRKHSSMDFLKWQIFLEEIECKVQDRTHYYLAQIVQYLVALNTEGGKLEDIQKYLITLTSKKPESDPKDMEAKARLKMKMSRAAWGGFLGVHIPLDDLEDPK
jgi:hypothetical protein